MFGTSITVIDGYGRAVAEAFSLIRKTDLHQIEVLLFGQFYIYYWILIIIYFASSMRTMLDFAMILSFTTTPIFAFLNYKLVRSTKLPKKKKELQNGMF